MGVGELLTQYLEVLVHDFAPFELFVVEVDDGVLEFGDMVEELVFHDFTIFSNGPLFFVLFDGGFLSHFHSFSFHFLHDFSGFCIIEFIEFIIFGLFPSSGLFFSLLFLLHDDLIPDCFLHDLE